MSKDIYYEITKADCFVYIVFYFVFLISVYISYKHINTMTILKVTSHPTIFSLFTSLIILKILNIFNCGYVRSHISTFGSFRIIVIITASATFLIISKQAYFVPMISIKFYKNRYFALNLYSIACSFKYKSHATLQSIYSKGSMFIFYMSPCFN